MTTFSDADLSELMDRVSDPVKDYPEGYVIAVRDGSFELSVELTSSGLIEVIQWSGRDYQCDSAPTHFYPGEQDLMKAFEGHGVRFDGESR